MNIVFCISVCLLTTSILSGPTSAAVSKSEIVKRISSQLTNQIEKSYPEDFVVGSDAQKMTQERIDRVTTAVYSLSAQQLNDDVANWVINSTIHLLEPSDIMWANFDSKSDQKITVNLVLISKRLSELDEARANKLWNTRPALVHSSEVFNHQLYSFVTSCLNKPGMIDVDAFPSDFAGKRFSTGAVALAVAFPPGSLTDDDITTLNFSKEPLNNEIVLLSLISEIKRYLDHLVLIDEDAYGDLYSLGYDKGGLFDNITPLSFAEALPELKKNFNLCLIHDKNNDVFRLDAFISFIYAVDYIRMRRSPQNNDKQHEKGLIIVLKNNPSDWKLINIK